MKSFELLVEKCGLVIRDIVFDSTEMQFWGSEQYKKGIPYWAENSYLLNAKKSIFSTKQIKEFRKTAKEININGQGDQAAFYLRKA
jgi:hypothetical protein